MTATSLAKTEEEVAPLHLHPHPPWPEEEEEEEEEEAHRRLHHHRPSTVAGRVHHLLRHPEGRVEAEEVG